MSKSRMLFVGLVLSFLFFMQPLCVHAEEYETTEQGIAVQSDEAEIITSTSPAGYTYTVLEDSTISIVEFTDPFGSITEVPDTIDGYRVLGTYSLTGTRRYDYAYEVLDIINRYRQEAGLSALVMDKDLLDATMLRSAEALVYFSHTRPCGDGCFTASSKMVAENIAGCGFGSPEAVMKGWMGSSGHRSNIMNEYVASVGVGVFVVDGRWVWLQCFGRYDIDPVICPSNDTSTYQIYVDDERTALTMELDNGKDTIDNLMQAQVVMKNSYTKTMNSDYVFSSSDDTIATVDEDGVLKGLKNGSVTITAKNKTTPSQKVSKEFAVTILSGKTDISKAQFSGVEKSYTYTGERICPTVAITYDGATLVEDVDYTVSYESNIAAGTAKIVITGIGAYYEGTKEITYDILEKNLDEVKYKVVYNLNGGTNSKKNPSSYKSTMSTITLSNPTRKGYTFKGWYTDKTYNSRVSQIPKGSIGEKIFFAKWKAANYKIKYYLKGGKNNKKNPTKYYITSSTVKLKNPTRKGYKFKGWYTTSKYKKKVTRIPKGSTGTKKLYAKWKKK